MSASGGHGSQRPSDVRPDLRPSWSASDRRIPRRVVRPLQAFLSQETAAGVLLVAAAVLALGWANSPWASAYERLWSTPLSIRLGSLTIAEDLRGWVTDGLMTIFFFVVALEIKREIVSGELRDRRAAALPVAAALGGMLVPALVLLAIVPASASTRSWGVAMPTDIAFALGILALAAPRAPTALKLFLLTLAIVDDLGTIVVIAFVYPERLEGPALAIALGIVVLFIVLQRNHVRSSFLYTSLGVGLWVTLQQGGVSPTLAGVVVGFLTPATAFQRPAAVSEEARRIAARTVDDPSPPDADAPEWLSLSDLSREAVSPLARAERTFHPWATWVVLPLFALANAGVALGGGRLADALRERFTVGLLAARLVGKPAGIVGAAALAVAVGLARRPEGVAWRHLAALSTAAAVPFAVSLFVAGLAFGRGPSSEVAVVAVLLTALATALVAWFTIRLTIGAASDDDPAGSPGRRRAQGS